MNSLERDFYKIGFTVMNVSATGTASAIANILGPRLFLWITERLSSHLCEYKLKTLTWK